MTPLMAEAETLEDWQDGRKTSLAKFDEDQWAVTIREE